MIINVTVPSGALKPIRLSVYNGRIFICFVDIVESSSIKDIVLDDDTNMKLITMIGEDNFTMIYPNIPVPLPYISREGLKKLIDYPEIEEYLIKMNLSKIDEFITKNKKRISEMLYDEEYKLKINKNISNQKVIINDKSYNDKMKEINHHIKEAKKHMDLAIKLQEELIKGEY